MTPLCVAISGSVGILPSALPKGGTGFVDEGQIPSGWFWAALAGAAVIGRAAEFPIAWIAGYFGWRKKRDAEQEAKRAEHEAKLVESVHAKVVERVEVGMSAIRQHVAEVQKGIEGKQGWLDARLAEFYKEMVGRDEQMTNSLHRRLSKELGEHEERIMRSLERQIDLLNQNLTSLVTTALNGRRRP